MRSLVWARSASRRRSNQTTALRIATAVIRATVTLLLIVASAEVAADLWKVNRTPRGGAVPRAGMAAD
ncbi:hypothetical protein GCM10022251_72760 [Phytohabitans flavus]